VPDNFFHKVSEWGWVSLVGVLTWIWNRFTNKIDHCEEAIAEHITADQEAHTKFVTFTYIKEEIKPLLGRLDEKMDTLVTQTADVIKREEYKTDITSLHNRINELEQRKVDRPL